MSESSENRFKSNPLQRCIVHFVVVVGCCGVFLYRLYYIRGGWSRFVGGGLTII
jgi:hypothetical protein